MGKADPLFIPAKDNRTVRLIRDLIALGEGTPELGFATNVGTIAEPLWRSGSGWVGNYFTTNSLGRVVRTAVPQGGLTREQNDLSNEAAGSFYRDALYRRYPEFAKAMPSEAMAVMGDVFHHGRQENTKSPVWDKDNRAVWAARNNDKVAQAYLLGRGYSSKWDFNEVAARQILDYTRDSGTNRIYRRVIQRFNVLRDKLGRDKRPWDYFDPKADKAKKDALTTELKKAWAEVNKGEQADEKGGTSRRDADVAREAEKIRSTRIRVEGDSGAVKGTVAEVAGLAPATQRGRIENAVEADAANRARRAEYDRLAAENRQLMGDAAGLARYDELTAKGRPDARSQTSDALAYALRDNPVLAPESRPDAPVRPTHDKNGHPLTYTQDSKWVPDAAPRATQRESSADREFREATHVPTGVTMIGGQKFTTYADGTVGDTTAEHIREARESKALSEALLRQDAKGGDAGGEVTENAEIVNSGEVADTPVTNGPRIVINPTTFRNRKDALCVAFNERFRIAMEQYGFEPQSAPTERQRRFFADTAYADDEVMLRRTILARILTLDTSVKDPTDEQMREALAFLGEFGRRERPSNDWEANAIRRLARLVESTLPKGDRK